MRALRVRVADALHDRQLPLLPHRPEASHRGVQPDVVVQANDVVPGLAERGPSLVVQVVGIGDDGVEAVIAAGQLQHDQDVVLAGRGRVGRPGHELRDHRVQGHQRRAFQRMGQELPAVKHVRYSVMDDEGHLRQLRFRHRQDGVDGLAHPTIEGGAGGLAPGDEGHELRLHVGADAAGKIQIQE